jgi:hypothetical protein
VAGLKLEAPTQAPAPAPDQPKAESERASVVMNVVPVTA